MPIITANGLKKYYGKNPIIVYTIDGVDISVKKGKFVAIVGMSGLGKSTLLHMLGGLDHPTEGNVIVDGHELSSMTEESHLDSIKERF